MLLDKFQMIANCYGGSNVLHMLILHSKCSINVPTSCVWPGTCRNIWNVPNLLLAGKCQVLSTRACNVLKMFSLVSRPPRPQCAPFPWKSGAPPPRSRCDQAVRSAWSLHCSRGALRRRTKRRSNQSMPITDPQFGLPWTGHPPLNDKGRSQWYRPVDDTCRPSPS